MTVRLPTMVTPTGVEFISSANPEIIIQPLYDAVLLTGNVQGQISFFQAGIGSQLVYALGFGVNNSSLLNSVTTKTLNWTIFIGQGAGRLGMPQTFRIERMNAWFNTDIEQRQGRAISDNTAFVFQVDDKPYIKGQLRHLLGGPAPSGFAGNTAITQWNGGPNDSMAGMRFPIPIGIPSQHDFLGNIQFDRPINLANPFNELVSPELTAPVKLSWTLYGAFSRAVK